MARRIIDYRKKLSLYSPIWLSGDKYYPTVKDAIDKDFTTMDTICYPTIDRDAIVKLDVDALCYLIKVRNERLYKGKRHGFTDEHLWKIFDNMMEDFTNENSECHSDT